MGLCWQAKLNPVFCLFNLSRRWQREGVAIICPSLDKAVSLSCTANDIQMGCQTACRSHGDFVTNDVNKHAMQI